MQGLIIGISLLLGILIIALIHFAISKITVNNNANEFINNTTDKYNIIEIKGAYMIDKYARDKIKINIDELITKGMLKEIIKYVNFEDETIDANTIVRNGTLFVVDRRKDV